MAKNNDWDNDDLAQAQAKGYFVGNSNPTPSNNFILSDDSTTFIYSPGEIKP